LRFGKRYRHQPREKCAGHDQRYPLHGQHARPIGVGKKNQQVMVSLASDAEAEQCRTESIENTACDFWRGVHKRESEKCRRQGIKLLRIRIWISVFQQIVGSADRRYEIACALMSVAHQVPAKHSGKQAEAG